ncbi:mRNA 3'-end-processing protein rna14 [Coemansia thaxteri]|nr:mRNA 3'-end-processing protein rna14 [Coemansia thaxteri]KAJ2462113.1 mRNA 3'-end-processing protein rna14 [Coemansia sp. RSA 2322]
MSDDASQASMAGPSGIMALFERAKRRVDARVAGTKARMERELVEKREIYTLAWIMYMRFVQRAEGIDAVRQLLRRPRADPSGYVTHHLFVAAALMEYHVAKKPGIAAKLFEFYSKMHSDQSAYIFEYLSYLINSGDDTNARALFERFQGTSTGDSGDMWSMFADFEYNYGDMSAIAKLDKRFIDKFEHESVLTRLAARYSYLDVASVAENEFGFPFRKEYRGDAPASSGHRRSTAALGDASPADIDSGSEFAGVAVASVSGRHLLKSQLLALVTPKRFVKMNTSALEEYDPIIEDFEPPEPQLHGNDAVSDSRHAASPIGVSSAMLLERGDLLSFVAASVASIDPQGFDSPALDPDALLGSIMELRGLKQQQVQSNYRPLAYMPRHGSAGVPQSRPGRHGGHPHAPLGRGRGYSGPGESSYGGRRPFTAPRRSPHKNQSHRLPPYSRSPSGNSRPPRHDSYGSRRSRSRGASYDDGGY